MVKINFEIIDDEKEENKRAVKLIGKNKSFVIDPNKALGWSESPFENKILTPVEKFMVNLEKQKEQLNLLLLKQKKVTIISGNRGSGKTIFLYWIKEKIKEYSNYRVCFIEAHKIRKIEDLINLIGKSLLNNLEKLIGYKSKLNESNIKNFVSKKLRNKKLIMLVDDFEKINEKLLKIIEEIIQHPNVFLILTTKDAKPFIRQKYETAHIKLPTLSYDQIRLILKKRIEHVGGVDILPLSDPILKKIVEKARHNLLKIFLMCEDATLKLAVKSHFDHNLRESLDKKRKEYLEKEEMHKNETKAKKEKKYSDAINKQEGENKSSEKKEITQTLEKEYSVDKIIEEIRKIGEK